jgi:hypothetical protein
MLHVIPFLLTWALLCIAPGSAPKQPANPVKRHPHHPQAIKIGGVKGDILVTYTTMPYNPERLKELKPGFSWHLGYAQLKTDVPLNVGETKVPAGTYKFNSQLNKDGKAWTLELQNLDLMQAKGQVMRAQRRGDEAAVTKAQDNVKMVEAKLKKAGISAVIALPTSAFKAEDDEHLTIHAINRGWTTAGRRTTDARGKTGVRGSLRTSFGNLHYQFDFEEVIEGAQDPQDQQPDRPRRRRR